MTGRATTVNLAQPCRKRILVWIYVDGLVNVCAWARLLVGIPTCQVPVSPGYIIEEQEWIQSPPLTSGSITTRATFPITSSEAAVFR